MQNDATPSRTKRPRRLPRLSQAEIARAFRAAQQVGNEFGVRVEPDGAIAICRLAPAVKTHGMTSQVRDFTL
jgi:hypothetical protein